MIHLTSALSAHLKASITTMAGIFGFQQSTGNSGPLEMFHGASNPAGEPLFEEVDRATYVVPSRGEYHLKVTGFSKPWTEELPERFRKPNGPTESTKTNLELEIVEGRGKGKRFLWSYQTFSLSCGDNPANLARVYMAAVLNGEKIPRGKQVFFEDMFGKEFVAYVVPSEAVNDEGRPKYATLSKESIAPVPASTDAPDDDDPFADPDIA